MQKVRQVESERGREGDMQRTRQVVRHAKSETAREQNRQRGRQVKTC